MIMRPGQSGWYAAGRESEASIMGGQVFMASPGSGEVAEMIGTKFDAGKSSAPDSIERVRSRPDFTVLVCPNYRPGLPRSARPERSARSGCRVLTETLFL